LKYMRLVLFVIVPKNLCSRYSCGVRNT
jgi:hypothetical protein